MKLDRNNQFDDAADGLIDTGLSLGRAANQLAIGLGLFDTRQRLTDANEALCSLLGRSREAVLGGTPLQLGLLPSPSQRRGALEVRLLRPDGSVVWLHAVLSRLTNVQGRGVGSAYVAIDLTDRIVAEQALRESDRHKGEFLSVLSHELRNPLAPVRNALALLQREALSKTGHQAVTIAQRQLAQSVRIVDDLLDTSRLSQGKVELRLERVQLAKIVQTALDNLQPMLAERQQQLACVLPEAPLWLTADPARLQQILENLLINASKYTDPGGGIELRAQVSGEHITVQIADTGLGIAPEHLPRVFELFKQVNARDARCHGGLGIGLALVKQLVELHGGQVSVRSAGVGQGSTFTFALPYRGRSLEQRLDGRPDAMAR